jgi:hypothetical protein
LIAGARMEGSSAFPYSLGVAKDESIHLKGCVREVVPPDLVAEPIKQGS